MPSIVSNTPGCEDCCDEETCLFNVSIGFYKCYYDYNGTPFPDGPLTLFNGLAGLWEEITGTMTYNGVTYQISISNFQGIQIPTQSFNNISKIDETSEVVINIDPLIWKGVNPGGESCSPGETIEYDEIRFIPKCGANNFNLVGKVTSRKIGGRASGCHHGRFLYFPGDYRELDGKIVGLEGATITVTTDVGTQTSEPYEKLTRIDECLNASEQRTWDYSTYWMEFDGIIPTGSRNVSITFNPPPAIPGYKSATYTSENLLLKTPSGPLDTCGYLESFILLGATFSTEKDKPWSIVKDEEYMCHPRGWPIRRKLNYSDGMFSGELISTSIGDSIAVGWGGWVSGNCPGSRRVVIKNGFPCCEPGGTTWMYVAVSLGTGHFGIPQPTDFWDYYRVLVRKYVKFCFYAKCEGGALLYDILAEDKEGVGGFEYAEGEVYRKFENSYTPLDVSVSLERTAPNSQTPCLEGIAHITEPP